eukprot:696037-Prorocentrum_minimum.AAC.1
MDLLHSGGPLNFRNWAFVLRVEPYLRGSSSPKSTGLMTFGGGGGGACSFFSSFFPPFFAPSSSGGGGGGGGGGGLGTWYDTPSMPRWMSSRWKRTQVER